MLLDSARGLKQALTETVLAPFTAAAMTVKAMVVPAGPISLVPTIQPSFALGIGRTAGNEFQIVVRCQRRELMTGKEVAQIQRKAKGEVDIRYIGPVTKRAAIPWTQQRHRPVRLGISVAHLKVTAGTLGAFVRKPGEIGTFILSNNHVLANENKGKPGDTIIQAGALDGGVHPADRVATLAGMTRLKKTGANTIDSAIAKLDAKIDFDPLTIRGLGKLTGLGSAFVDVGTEVAKLGRTTGLTRGQVTAFELDNIIVSFDTGLLRFDGQIEIEGLGDDPFSQGGDSGSLIVETGTRLAVGLLFSGTDTGGANDNGLTYAHPIRTVLEALKVDLVSA
jgi:hypothetical protein